MYIINPPAMQPQIMAFHGCKTAGSPGEQHNRTVKCVKRLARRFEPARLQSVAFQTTGREPAPTSILDNRSLIPARDATWLFRAA